MLRFFVDVYEEKNLTKAAEKCFVSQPNISNGIKQLEEALQKPLFTRHKRGVYIKEHGHYLYPIAKRILGEISSLPDLFREQQLKQKVCIGIADSLPQPFKQKFFRETTAQIDNIEWDVRSMGRECEINILVREWKFEEHLFLPLWQEDYVLCIPENHHLKEKEVICVEDLINEPFIHCPPCEAHQQTLSLLNHTGAKWNTIANCSTKTEVLSLLMAGLGISFLPEEFARGWNGFLIKPFDGPRHYREIGLSYPKESLNNQAIEAIIKQYTK